MRKSLITLSMFFLILLMGCQQQELQAKSVPETPLPVEEASEEPPQPTEGEKIQTAPAEADESESVPPVKEFGMIAKQFEFVPSTIEVSLGDRVIIKMKSDDVAHGFSLSAFGIRERLDPGKEVTVDFIADRKGEFRFFCSVPCGSGHGAMQGTLIVK